MTLAGNLGVFDFFSLVDALVAGAVLLGVAQLIVTYVALYALGLSSKLYMEFMRESVNWRKEYARFGVQCLVVGSTFLSFDKNKSGTLDRREIYASLTEVLKDTLEAPKIASLTDFLMRHSEKDADVSVGRLEEVSNSFRFSDRGVRSVIAAAGCEAEHHQHGRMGGHLHRRESVNFFPCPVGRRRI